MSQDYFRPIVQCDQTRPTNAVAVAGGSLWFTHAQRCVRGGVSERVRALDIPDKVLHRLTAPRPDICGLPMDRPVIMGVLNATPDSFSDGGLDDTNDQAVARAQQMIAQGAQIIDVGGESTRPGAKFVDAQQEIERTIPLLSALRDASAPAALSIDTRKAQVAEAALAAGASMFNDVSGFDFDAASLPLAVRLQPYVCLMHAQGLPETMQDAPDYHDVVLDVYDNLAGKVEACVAAGLSRDRIVVDPGIGFGKTIEHNVMLLKNLSLFHGLGCPILLGVSRKHFIGVIGDAQEPAQRAPGSIAVALEALRQGVQLVRVHDVWQTRQAFDLWAAMRV